MKGMNLMNRENPQFYILVLLSILCMIMIAVTPFPVHAAELPEEPPASSQESAPPEESSSDPQEPAPPEESSSAPQEPAPPEESSSAPQEPAPPEESSSTPQEPAPPEESSSTPQEPAPPEESSSAPQEPAPPEELPLDPLEPLPLTIEEQTLLEVSAIRKNTDIFLYLVIPVCTAILLIYKFCLWFYCTFFKSAL